MNSQKVKGIKEVLIQARASKKGKIKRSKYLEKDWYK